MDQGVEEVKRLYKIYYRRASRRTTSHFCIDVDGGVYLCIYVGPGDFGRVLMQLIWKKFCRANELTFADRVVKFDVISNDCPGTYHTFERLNPSYHP